MTTPPCVAWHCPRNSWPHSKLLRGAPCGPDRFVPLSVPVTVPVGPFSLRLAAPIIRLRPRATKEERDQMSEYTRTTRRCAFADLRPELVTAIRHHCATYGLATTEANALICCETASRRDR